MKTFEQKFTAWLDGTLSGQELQSFESQHPSILHEKADFLKLRSLLKVSLHRPELKSPDFFNSRIMEQDQPGSGVPQSDLLAGGG